MAQEKQFPFKESLKAGWNIAKDNFFFFLLVVIVLAVFSGIGNIITPEMVKEHPQLGLLNFILLVVSVFLSVLLNIGIIKIILDFLDGKKPKFKELFLHSNKVINMFVSSLLYGLIVFGGIILLIVPGIIWGLKFSLYKYFIVEKNAGPVEALKLSAQATAGAKWNLFLFGFVVAGVNLLGLLCFGIGIVFTIPLTWIAMVFVYRKLVSQIGSASPAPVAPAPTPTA